MAAVKEIKVKGVITRNGEKVLRGELPKEEQLRLAIKWNETAMEAAG